MNFFSRITSWVISVETDVVRLICTILPWLVPLVPAWLTYRHAIDQMGYSNGISLVMGTVVEGLGLASLVTSFSFWAHNRKFKDDRAHMPMLVPIVTYIVYLAIVLLVNVVLDIESGVSTTRILVVALFSLLSLPAGALLSVQTIYNEWYIDYNEAIEKRRQERNRARENEAKAREKKEDKENGSVMGVVRQHLHDAGIRPSEVGEGPQFRMKAIDIANELNLQGKARDNIRQYIGRLKKIEELGQWN